MSVSKLIYKQVYSPYSFKTIKAEPSNKKYLIEIAKIMLKVFSLSNKEVRKNVEDMIEDQSIYFLLLKDDEVVSVAMKDEFSGVFGITNICSLEKRKGYASTLLMYIKLFYPVIRLEVWDYEEDYSSPLLEFYSSLGFKVIKEYTKAEDNMPSHSEGKDIDKIFLMEWRKENE